MSEEFVNVTDMVRPDKDFGTASPSTSKEEFDIESFAADARSEQGVVQDFMDESRRAIYPGYVSGLRMSYVDTQLIKVTSGEFGQVDGIRKLEADLTVDLESLPASAFIYIHVAFRDVNTELKFFQAPSFDAPIIPDGFNRSRFIGALATNSSNEIRKFIQVGGGTARNLYLEENFLVKTGITSTFSLATDTVPDSAVAGLFYADYDNNSNSNIIISATPELFDGATAPAISLAVRISQVRNAQEFGESFGMSTVTGNIFVAYSPTPANFGTLRLRGWLDGL